MSTPGAKISVHRPKFELHRRVGVNVVSEPLRQWKRKAKAVPFTCSPAHPATPEDGKAKAVSQPRRRWTPSKGGALAPEALEKLGGGNGGVLRPHFRSTRP